MTIISTLSSFSHTLFYIYLRLLPSPLSQVLNQFFDRKSFLKDDGCPYPTTGCENSYIKQQSFWSRCKQTWLTERPKCKVADSQAILLALPFKGFFKVEKVRKLKACSKLRKDPCWIWFKEPVLTAEKQCHNNHEKPCSSDHIRLTSDIQIAKPNLMKKFHNIFTDANK